MKAGDKIRIKHPVMGYLMDFEVEEFRYCLGVFESDEHRRAGRITPLCDLYESGSESERFYIPNFGEAVTNQVPSWMDITEIKYKQ